MAQGVLCHVRSCSDFLYATTHHLLAAIASNVALGYSVPDAIQKACRYVEASIKTSIDLGRGSGPINHFHSTYMLPFSQ